MQSSSSHVTTITPSPPHKQQMQQKSQPVRHLARTSSSATSELANDIHGNVAESEEDDESNVHHHNHDVIDEVDFYF